MAEDYKYSAEATFRGFRAQTLYILNRLIKDEGNFKFQPEGNEDLDIYFENDLKELVQVKFYSNNLTLSDLEPEKDSSFLKRSVKRFKNGQKPRTTLISFGPIGPELKNGFKNCGIESSRIKTKLFNKGYENFEIDLIFENIHFVTVSEKKLEEEIFDYLKKNHGGFNPKVTFDLLMNWIYKISENAQKVKKIDLIHRLNDVASYLSAISSFLEEYGVSVNQLEIPENIHTYKKLEKEFYSGIHTRYEHIVANLDFKRYSKLNEITEEFEKNNVVIIHGASGQGKSTLAYRFLHEYYPNSLIYQIKSKERDALRIINTLNSISNSIDDKIAIFIDVEPSDTVWREIVKEISRYPKFNVLVTIREEDWERNKLYGADLRYSEIKLSLNKEEAEKIYSNLLLKVPKTEFLDFEDAWLKFGGNGPLLEFTYLITQGQSLRDRLEQQVHRIRMESDDAGEIERLDVLRIISIIGMYGCKTDLKSIFSTIKLKDPQYILKIFQAEYLIREENNGKYIGALHPIRSKILAEILSDPVLKPIESDIGLCLSVIREEDTKLFLLNCFMELIDHEVLGSIENHISGSWISYGLIIESLLWLGVKEYFELNIDVINEASDKFGSGWNLALIPDLAGASKRKFDDFFENELFNDEFREETKFLRSKLTSKSSIYKFLEDWLLNSNIPSKNPQKGFEWQNMGLSLFWLGKLNIDKEICFSEYSFDDCFKLVPLEFIADFMLGLHYFDSENDIFDIYDSIIIERFKKEFLVPSIEDDGEKITLHCIIDLIELDKRSKFHKEPLNEFIMSRLSLIRKFRPDRKIFATKGYGNEFFFLKSEWDDTIKNIPIDNFPLDWLINMNATFLAFGDYELSPDTWEEYIEYIVQNRVTTLEFIKKLIKNLQIFFKKSTNINMLQLNSLDQHWDVLRENMSTKKFPKAYANLMRINTPNLDIIKSISRFDRYNKSYSDFISDFNNFLNQGTHVIILQSLAKGKSPEQIEAIKKELDKKGFRTDINDLSLFNLYESYEHLLIFQEEFRNLFGNQVKYDLSDLEIQENKFYSLLVSLWRIFAIDGYKKDKKIIETAEKEFRTEKENVSLDILKNLEMENFNVKLISCYLDNIKENFLIFNVSEPIKIVETILNVINTIKNQLKDVSWTDLKKLFLDLEFEHFKIIILVEGKLLLPIIYNFPLFRVFSQENPELDILDFNPKPLTNEIEYLNLERWQDKIPEIKELENSFMVEELQQLLYHLTQFTDLDLDDLGYEITQNYANRISVKLSEDFQKVLDFLAFTVNILNDDLEILKEEANTQSLSSDRIQERKEELLDVFDLFDRIQRKLIQPLKEDNNSNKIDIRIKLEDIDEWYNRVQETKIDIYTIYLYFANKYILGYKSTA